MRICSLLPSITEVLFELGLGESVVAVTHECDWPAAARTKRAVTASRIRGEGQSSAEIDRLVREADGSLYDLDRAALAELRPDVILTQSLCPVCAVSEATVREVASGLPGGPDVFSFHPLSLADVRRMIREIGVITSAADRAERLIARVDSAIETVQRGLAGVTARPRVVLLEWTDPPFACGHWNPELVELAGGTELLGRVGEPSRRIRWEELIAADPDTIVVAPCGFELPRVMQEVASLADRAEWNNLRAVEAGRVFATDGSAYFNRPGARLIESLFVLAEVLQPERFRGLAPRDSFQQVAWAGRSRE